MKASAETLEVSIEEDERKQPFAKGFDDAVAATTHTSVANCHQPIADSPLARLLMRTLGSAGISPARIESALKLARRAQPAAFLRKLTALVDLRKELRVYRLDRTMAKECNRDSRINRNSISNLALFEPTEPWQTRDRFLSSARDRMECGETAYTACADGLLIHCGWMAAQQAAFFSTEVQHAFAMPPGSAVLYDFYTHPNFRGRGLYRAAIGHALADAFARDDIQYAYIGVLADNVPSRRVIESVGFQHQGSIFWRRRLGSISKILGSGLVAPASGGPAASR